MTTKLRNALGAAVALVAALLIALFTGALDGVLRRVGVEIAGRPASIEPAGSEVVATTPAAPKADPALPTGGDAGIAQRVIPVFDLVRVEPSGDAVIAGQGTPDGMVEILSGTGVIAEGKVNSSGEWAIVLKDPLPAGPHDLKVRVKTADGQVIGSEQSVAVSVPEGGKGEVLVVLNTPGAPATVLQIPGLEDAQRRVGEAGGEVASAGTDVAIATPPPVTAPAAPSTDTATRSADAGATSPAASGTPEASASAPTAPGSGASVAATASQSGEAPATEPAPAAQPSTASSGASQAPTASASGSGTAGTESAANTGQSVATATPAAPATSAPAAGPQAVAGGAASNAPSGAAPSAAPASGGETVVVAGATPEQPATTVNPPPAAATAPASQAPAASESPTTAAPGELAAAAPSDAAGAAPQDPATVPGSSASGSAVAPKPAPVTVDAVELEDGKKFYAAGSAAPGATVRVYVDDQPVADTKAMETGRWLLETELPLGSGKHAVRVDQIGPSGAVLARSEVPYELGEDMPPGPTGASGSGVAAVGSGTIGEARGQPETLIIRRGDNLWRIARRLYGHGMRYSTIYQANAEQIRNPDLIYPGQIFVLPRGDTAWRAAEPTVQPQ